MSPQRAIKAQGELTLTPGKTALRWGNTFSWFTQKTLSYETILTTESALSRQAAALAERRRHHHLGSSRTSAHTRLVQLQQSLEQSEIWISETQNAREGLLQVAEGLTKLGERVAARVGELDAEMNGMFRKIDNIQQEMVGLAAALGPNLDPPAPGEQLLQMLE